MSVNINEGIALLIYYNITSYQQKTKLFVLKWPLSDQYAKHLTLNKPLQFP